MLLSSIIFIALLQQHEINAFAPSTVSKSILMASMRYDQSQTRDLAPALNQKAYDKEELLNYLNKSGGSESFEEYVLQKKLKSFLKACPIFSACSSDDLGRIANSMVAMKVSEGEKIIEKGQQGNSMYFLDKGIVEATNLETGDVFMTYSKKGSFFGELALLFKQPRAASVVAKETSKLYKVDREAFLQAMTDSPVYEMAKKLMLKKYKSSRLREILTQIQPDELVDLARTKLQTVKGKTGSGRVSSVMIFGMGACATVYTSLLQPGGDSWPHLLDLTKSSTTSLPTIMASSVLMIASLLRAVELPKIRPTSSSDEEKHLFLSTIQTGWISTALWAIALSDRRLLSKPAWLLLSLWSSQIARSSTFSKEKANEKKTRVRIGEITTASLNYGLASLALAGFAFPLFGTGLYFEGLFSPFVRSGGNSFIANMCLLLQLALNVPSIFEADDSRGAKKSSSDTKTATTSSNSPSPISDFPAQMARASISLMFAYEALRLPLQFALKGL